MGAAAGAGHLVTVHTMAHVVDQAHVPWNDHLGEIWPAVTQWQSAGGIEQRAIATEAAVMPGLLVVPELATEGLLCAPLPADEILQRTQFLLPLAVTFTFHYVFLPEKAHTCDNLH